jgi:hypothetical protein
MKTHPLKHHFIRGYNDGDGCFCCREDGNIGFSMLGTKKFLTVIKKVLQDECNVSKSVNLNVRENIYCLAYWKQQDVKNIANYLYKDSNIFLPRKYDIVNKIV